MGIRPPRFVAYLNIRNRAYVNGTSRFCTPSESNRPMRSFGGAITLPRREIASIDRLRIARAASLVDNFD